MQKKNRKKIHGKKCLPKTKIPQYMNQIRKVGMSGGPLRYREKYFFSFRYIADERFFCKKKKKNDSKITFS